MISHTLDRIEVFNSVPLYSASEPNPRELSGSYKVKYDLHRAYRPADDRQSKGQVYVIAVLSSYLSLSQSERS